MTLPLERLKKLRALAEPYSHMKTARASATEADLTALLDWAITITEAASRAPETEPPPAAPHDCGGLCADFHCVVCGQPGTEERPCSTLGPAHDDCRLREREIAAVRMADWKTRAAEYRFNWIAEETKRITAVATGDRLAAELAEARGFLDAAKSERDRWRERYSEAADRLHDVTTRPSAALEAARKWLSEVEHEGGSKDETFELLSALVDETDGAHGVARGFVTGVENKANERAVIAEHELAEARRERDEDWSAAIREAANCVSPKPGRPAFTVHHPLDRPRCGCSALRKLLGEPSKQSEAARDGLNAPRREAQLTTVVSALATIRQHGEALLNKTGRAANLRDVPRLREGLIAIVALASAVVDATPAKPKAAPAKPERS